MTETNAYQQHLQTGMKWHSHTSVFLAGKPKFSQIKMAEDVKGPMVLWGSWYPQKSVFPLSPWAIKIMLKTGWRIWNVSIFGLISAPYETRAWGFLKFANSLAHISHVDWNIRRIRLCGSYFPIQTPTSTLYTQTLRLSLLSLKSCKVKEKSTTRLS